jgi:hypothetical protein
MALSMPMLTTPESTMSSVKKEIAASETNKKRLWSGSNRSPLLAGSTCCVTSKSRYNDDTPNADLSASQKVNEPQ